ncbi:MAG: glycosyltransferase involved in cell wall biosynthesis [Candidatus Poriferisodalaceae bacterium]
MTLSVAGAGLPDDVECRLSSRPSIDVLGRVADLEAWWRGCTVAAFPVKVRGGVPLKLIEALERGRATVVSPELVVGLDLTDGRDVLIRDTPRAFAEAIDSLLASPDERRRLEVNACEAFVRSFSWSDATEALLSGSFLGREVNHELR